METLYQDTEQYICHKYKNRDEWKAKRIQGIGGSDASTLVGLNPWKDNNTLWKEKKGVIEAVDISDRPYIQYGIEAEDLLRKLFALDFPYYDVQYIDNVTLQSKEIPWLLYSPDGLLIDKRTGMKGIFECKTTNILQSMQKEKWNNRIPDNYYVQVLHGLLVTGFDFVVLKAQLKTEYKDGNITLVTKHYIIYRDGVLEDLEWLKQKEIEQYETYYIKNIEPPTILPML